MNMTDHIEPAPPEDDFDTVIELHIVSGEDRVEKTVQFNSDMSKMNILLEGELKDGAQHVTITASGPAGDAEGVQELGQVLQSLGEVLASPQMAAHVSESGESDDK